MNLTPILIGSPAWYTSDCRALSPGFSLTQTASSDYKTQLDFGNYLEGQGRHAEALAHYKTAADVHPTDGGLLSRIAYMVMYYNKDYNGAINYYTKAMAADPANVNRYQENIKYCQAQMHVSTPREQQ